MSPNLENPQTKDPRLNSIRNRTLSNLDVFGLLARKLGSQPQVQGVRKGGAIAALQLEHFLHFLLPDMHITS